MLWLEEDVAVLHRRLRDEGGDGAGGTGGANCSADAQALFATELSEVRQLVVRLDSELSSERRQREQTEARLNILEEAFLRERRERDDQLRSFSNELETTMRGLIGRLDEGLDQGALAMREKTDLTEDRLRTLIKRVDEGLSAGAAALQDTLSYTVALGDTQARARSKSPNRGRQVGGHSYGLPVNALAMPVESATSDQLVHSYDQLRQENLRLREQRVLLHGAPQAQVSAAQTFVPARTPQGQFVTQGPAQAYPAYEGLPRTIPIAPGSLEGSVRRLWGQQP